MKSLRINFEEGGATLSLDTLVSGAEAEIQNALVNVGTSRGSDPIYPNRGTDLLKEAAQGAIVDLNSARHAANFAALYTLNFIQETIQESMSRSVDRIQQLELLPPEFDGISLSFQVVGNTLDGRDFGVNSSILS